MNDILEILKYTLPSVVVFLTSWLVLKTALRNSEKRWLHELSMNRKDTTFPLQLQAYERLILLLERISPDSLVMRINSASMNSAQLQNEMISNIRQEFEHNLAQQTYVGIETWEKIKAARTEMIRLINTSAAEIRPSDPGINLSKRILEKAMELQKSPTAEAINYLKNEVQNLI